MGGVGLRGGFKGAGMDLTSAEWDLLLQSLYFTRRAFEDTGIEPYGPYPSYEFKLERIREVEVLVKKLKGAKQ
jgi:hypothetical protein